MYWGTKTRGQTCTIPKDVITGDGDESFAQHSRHKTEGKTVEAVPNKCFPRVLIALRITLYIPSIPTYGCMVIAQTME